MHRHIWILNILEDIKEYADLNNLHDLKAKIDDVNVVAQREIGHATLERSPTPVRLADYR